MIPLSVPNLSDLESRAVQQVVESGWISSAGPEVTKFEQVIAEYIGRKEAVAVVNGTAALHLALQLLGVEAGELVIAPALGFVASVNAVRYCGADPVLIDVSAEDWQMDADLLERFLREECEMQEGKCMHRESRKRIRVLMVVNVLGYVGPMAAYQKLAEAFGLEILEDAAESLGTQVNGRHAGTFGKISTLSFNGNKVMSSGGGGSVVLNDIIGAARARHLSAQAKSHPSEYLHDEVGYNYRLPNLNAALGLAQFQRLEEFLQRKREVNDFYRQALAGIQQINFYPKPTAGSNHWLFTILAENSRELQAHLQSRGIQSRKLWVPIPKLPPYQDAIHYMDTHQAQLLYESSLSLPCSTGITDEQLETVAEAIRTFYR